MNKPKPLHLRVVIPHFFREGGGASVEGSYGSSRAGNRLPRSLALARCLGSVLALNRSPCDRILNIAQRHIETTPPSSLAGLDGVSVELHVFVCGDSWLQEVIELYASRIQLHCLELEDPRQLPLAAVRSLFDFQDSAELSLYLEDDLIIHDPRYADKLAWFYQNTNHQAVLMPHRYEPTVANAPQKLYVDGPIQMNGLSESAWAHSEQVIANAQFWDGEKLSFCVASNPHSGSACMSAVQIEKLRAAPWPPATFVGPLETAATGIVLGQFPILKPSWACRHFLSIEHGNPSFLGYLSKLPQHSKRMD